MTDALAAEARRLLGALREDPQALKYAYGSTATERVLDLARDLEAALDMHESGNQESDA